MVAPIRAISLKRSFGDLGPWVTVTTASNPDDHQLRGRVQG